MTTENLRREARVDVCVPVVVYRGKVSVALETTDVSFKGLFVRTTDSPALRALVRLKVMLFDREFEAHAMAVHVVPVSAGDAASDGHEPGVGLQFWGLAGPDRTAWDDFVRALVQTRRAAAKRAKEIAPDSESDPSASSGTRTALPPARASRE